MALIHLNCRLLLTFAGRKAIEAGVILVLQVTLVVGLYVCYITSY